MSASMQMPTYYYYFLHCYIDRLLNIIVYLNIIGYYGLYLYIMQHHSNLLRSNQLGRQSLCVNHRVSVSIVTEC